MKGKSTQFHGAVFPCQVSKRKKCGKQVQNKKQEIGIFNQIFYDLMYNITVSRIQHDALHTSFAAGALHSAVDLFNGVFVKCSECSGVFAGTPVRYNLYVQNSVPKNCSRRILSSSCFPS